MENWPDGHPFSIFIERYPVGCDKGELRQRRKKKVPWGTTSAHRVKPSALRYIVGAHGVRPQHDRSLCKERSKPLDLTLRGSTLCSPTG